MRQLADRHAGRSLIVNADDFGASPGVNRGIVRTYELGVVTSASLMVRAPAAADAAAHARRRPTLSVGLHLDLGEWQYRDGQWVALYEIADTSDAAAVAAAVEHQLGLFRELLGAEPTHLDSHQHVHRAAPVAQILAGAGRRLGIPVRHHDQHVAYRGDFYGQTGRGEPYPQAITVDALVAILVDLPAGTTELGCHPGYDDGGCAVYRSEREQEMHVLCDPSVREAIVANGVQLRSFRDLGA